MAAEDRYRGLGDGFVEYRTPSDEDYQVALREGLLVVDTNVLLNLYRYHPAAREDLIRILAAVGDRLFVPSQVALEFWRNREGTIRASAEQTSQLRTELDATNADPVLERLESLLEGQVGSPLSAGDHEQAEAEAQRRIDHEEPPGYADGDKASDARFGDYLLWKQLLIEAASRGLDVLLVTGDVKEDWWRREAGETRGPRLELSRELNAAAGVRLFMLRPASLFALAERALNLEIREESVRAAETVDRLSTRFARVGGRHRIEKVPDGRRGSYLDTVVEMASLAEGSPSIDEYLDFFQQRFPSIGRRDVARRRTSGIVESLGLVEIHGGRVALTEVGQRLLEERTLEIVQDAFMERIAGAPEVRDLAVHTPLSALRADLRDDPPAGLTQTQAALVLRWLEQLDLI